jgi:hypothetical protein
MKPFNVHSQFSVSDWKFISLRLIRLKEGEIFCYIATVNHLIHFSVIEYKFTLTKDILLWVCYSSANDDISSSLDPLIFTGLFIKIANYNIGSIYPRTLWVLVCGKRQEDGKVKSTGNDDKFRNNDCITKRGDSPKVTC